MRLVKVAFYLIMRLLPEILGTLWSYLNGWPESAVMNPLAIGGSSFGTTPSSSSEKIGLSSPRVDCYLGNALLIF